MTEILRVFNEIFTAKVDYCVICLRSSQETRLESLRNVENFIKSINVPLTYVENAAGGSAQLGQPQHADYSSGQFQKLCYVCARGAAAALRFRRALAASAAVHGLFVRMRRAGRPHLPAGAAQWEAALARVRARTELLQTEVLVVDSRHERQTNTTYVEAAGSPGACEDMYLIPDARPPSATTAAAARRSVHQATVDVLSEPEIYMESVVIIDEEEDPIHIKLEEGPPPPLPCLPTILPRLAPPAPPAPPSLVPIERLLGGRSTSDVSIIPQGQLVQRNPSEPTNFLLHPVVVTDGVITVPSLAAQVVDGKLVAVNSSSVAGSPRLALQDGPNYSLLTDPARVSSLLRNIGAADAGTVTVVSDDIAVNVLEQNVMRSMELGGAAPAGIRIGNVTSMAGGAAAGGAPAPGGGGHSSTTYDFAEKSFTSERKGTEGAPPVSGGRETDWEDKIPMDVISFMDATDPNAPAVVAPAPSLLRKSKGEARPRGPAPQKRSRLHNLTSRSAAKLVNDVIDLC